MTAPFSRALAAFLSFLIIKGDLELEELRLLSKEYYQKNVDIKLFGLTGGLFLLLSMPFLGLSIYLNFYTVLTDFVLLPMLISASFWSFAKKEYKRNLIRRLAFFTHLESTNVSEHKAVYLQLLTSHIADNLYETMKAFRDITETNAKNRSFVLDNGWYHFFNFLYNPDAKNRILSLLIYLISLVAVLTVIKPDTGVDFYEIIHNISFSDVKTFFIMSIFLILLGYVILVVPLMFIISYAVVPLLLKFSSASMLSRYFISEINKYAFVDVRVLQLTKPSTRCS
ncbi:hypothetical protein MHO82_25215 [Vibrio sp. Of7-15]|uniref:hypothetical protein n=1 Tax=Vibrio sp. Of7-15 TaxID=2724879 RepID=UPI001EF3828D|nr:hypothetical protein [Vibrio sp. Of7-15]MCG7500166.1 hypothetical protein [Vibrio sp. Of7-15]